MKKVLGALGGALAFTAAIVVVRAVRDTPNHSKVPPVPKLALDENALAEHLGQALTFRTVSRQDGTAEEPESFRALHQYLAQTFPKVYATLDHEEVNHDSLLFRWQGTDPSLSPVLLLAHQDVVPVPEETENAWTHPGFSGEVRDGFVWGRGALDDKGPLIAILEAFEHLIAEGFRPARTLYLGSGHDEEVGGHEGSWQIEQVLAQRKVHFSWVLDEGMPIVEGFIPDVPKLVAMIGVAEKGYLSLELSVEAEGGHSSQPPPDGSAVGKLAEAVRALELNPMPSRIEGSPREMLETLAPEMAFNHRLAIANLWLFSPLVRPRLESVASTNSLIRTTAAPTLFTAGVKENVLCTRATAVVNFRILPGDSIESVMAHVRRVIGNRVKVTKLQKLISEPSRESRVDGPGFHAVSLTIRQVFPQVVVSPGLVVGSTDARHFAPIAGDVYRFVPNWLKQEDFKRFHGVDERVSVETFANEVRFYAQLIKNL